MIRFVLNSTDDFKEVVRWVTVKKKGPMKGRHLLIDDEADQILAGPIPKWLRDKLNAQARKRKKKK